MGYVIGEIERLITQQLQEHGLILWFDPERFYEKAVPGLTIQGCTTLIFDGSYYALRAATEPLIRGPEAPRLLIYLPLTYDDAKSPLAELLAFGKVVRPGGIGQRNTKPAVVARRALRNRVAESRLADLDRQIEKGQITLTDLEQLGEEGGSDALPTVLAVLFNTTAVEEAALDFLAHANRDVDLISRKALADWVQAMRTQLGVVAGPELSAAQVRTVLARQALSADLLETLGEDTPSELKAVVAAKGGTARQRCAEIARAWRNRRDLGSSYREAADAVEKTLHLESIEFSDLALIRTQIFSGLERRLLRRIASRLAAGEDAQALQTAEQRRSGFWSEQEPDLQAEWSLILQAATLLRTAKEIEAALQKPHTSEEIIRAYTREENPWSRLDTLQRWLEKRASSLEFALSDPPAEIETLVTRARQRYAEAGGRMAEAFLRSWEAGGFDTAGFYRQTDVYETFVAPVVREHRTAYILVDALRFELARELMHLLDREFDPTLEVVIGTAPAITDVGMAALLPRAATGMQVSGDQKLQVELHGQVIRNRQERMDYLRKNVDVPTVDLRLEEPKTFKRKVKELVSNPALVVVTSREIDQSGEDEMTGAREHMEKVLTHLSLALRKLAEADIERIVIASDHGFLFGEDLADSDKIDPPGGKQALLHRRVWVGEGGAASNNYMRTTLAKLGVSSHLEIAVPWNLTIFRTSGSTAYFHGGLSPQEILLPVLTLVPRGWAAGQSAKKVDWQLTLGSPKITTRFLSIRILGRSQALFATDWPQVRLEVRAGEEVCSMPVSGTYGLNEATGEVTLHGAEGDTKTSEPNTVALMLTGKAPTSGMVSVYLIDATTGVALMSIENVEVSIAI